MKFSGKSLPAIAASCSVSLLAILSNPGNAQAHPLRQAGSSSASVSSPSGKASSRLIEDKTIEGSLDKSLDRLPEGWSFLSTEVGVVPSEDVAGVDEVVGASTMVNSAETQDSMDSSDSLGSAGQTAVQNKEAKTFTPQPGKSMVGLKNSSASAQGLKFDGWNSMSKAYEWAQDASYTMGSSLKQFATQVKSLAGDWIGQSYRQVKVLARGVWGLSSDMAKAAKVSEELEASATTPVPDILSMGLGPARGVGSENSGATYGASDAMAATGSQEVFNSVGLNAPVRGRMGLTVSDKP